MEKRQTNPLLDVLAGNRISPPPIWLMRQAGRYLPEYRALRQKVGSFLELCYTPELACEVTLQPIERFDFDAAILFSDILVIPDALGQDVRFEPGVGPVLGPVRTSDDLIRLSSGRVAEHLAPVMETVKAVRAALDPNKALIGFAGAPWTVATYMIEGGGSKDQAMARRRAFEAEDGFMPALIDLLVDATSDYLIAQAQASADALMLFDSWAGALGGRQFERWVTAPTKEIVTRVKRACPDVPVIGFPRGSGLYLADFAAATEVDALAIDYSIEAERADEMMPGDLPLQGNLDPMALVAGGDVLAREIDRILDAFSGRPHVFNLGHGIVPETPIAHVDALVAKVRGAS